MPQELEYVVNGALLKCNQGTLPTPFKGTINTSIKVSGAMVTTEMDKAPMANIVPFGICQVLSKTNPVPCVPAPTMWQDTYPVKVKGCKTLLFKSCMNCGVGGKMEFVTSGQIPLPPDEQAQLDAMNAETKEQLEEAKKEEESVGEAGLFEGMIPVWGSGRDMIHALQTGDGWGAALNAGFLIWDVVSIVTAPIGVGVIMQGAKAAVKGGLKVAVKRGAKALLKKAAQQVVKGKALAKTIGKSVDDFAKATGKVCVFACFPAGTPVYTKNGLVPIEQIKVSDEVWAWNEETGETGLKKVLNTMQREASVLVEVTLDGEKIICTPEHPFYANGAWKDAGLLEVNDEVKLFSGKVAKIEEVKYSGDYVEVEANNVTIEIKEEERKKVYNFEVEAWHTYFVGWWKILTHNVCITQSIKCLIKNTQGLLHSFDRHAAQWFGRNVPKVTHLKLWEKLLEKASKSKYVFPWKTGSTLTTAKLAKIEGKYFVVQFFKDGSRAGEIATAFVPNNKQLSQIFNLLK